MNLRLFSFSGAVLAPLLICVLFSLSACGLTLDADDAMVKGATGASEKTTNVSEEATSVRKQEITRAAQGQNATTTASGKAMDTAFVHRSDEKNSRGDYTPLSDPNIDGNPNAVVLVMSIPDQKNTGDDTYDHNVGVWYEPQAQRWAIFNEDRVAVPAGTAFQAVVPGGPEKIVHRAESGNIDEDSTYLDDPSSTESPGRSSRSPRTGTRRAGVALTTTTPSTSGTIPGASSGRSTTQTTRRCQTVRLST